MFKGSEGGNAEEEATETGIAGGGQCGSQTEGGYGYYGGGAVVPPATCRAPKKLRPAVEGASRSCPRAAWQSVIATLKTTPAGNLGVTGQAGA